jgi:hypothetical protein
MSANLGIKITHDADTEHKLARFRLLAHIEAGNMPAVSTPLVLQREEICHGQLSCQLHEKRTVTKAIRFSGPVARIHIMRGLSWRFGSISLNRVTREEMRQIDAGTLYITNKRLLFNGAGKNFSVPYKKVVQFTAYKDGLKIERDSGRDQYFIGSGDHELLAAILETCLRLSRES